MTESWARLLDEGIARAGFTRLPVPVPVAMPSPAGTARAVTLTVTDHDAVARGSALMLRDASGAATFHLPVRTPVPGIAEQLVFDIPASRLRQIDAGGEQSLVPLAPIAEVLVDEGGKLLGGEFVKWYRDKEQHDHPHRIRHVVTDSGHFAAGDEVTDWSALHNKTVLLFVHGVLSSSQNCFHGLPDTVVGELTSRYPATLCFDHPSVSVDPRENVRWFLAQIPQGINIRFQIIAHSRGGLISRILAGGLRAEVPVPEGIEVETIALAGTPNRGTPIVSVAKWGALVDRLANLAAAMPGPFHDAGEFIADVLQLLKVMAADAMAQFPGLDFMLDGQSTGVLHDLDAALATTNAFYAIDTEFWPSHVLWHIFDLHRDATDVAEVLVDHAVFDRVPNDIAVPTPGVRGTGLNGGGFPISAGYSFGRSGTVWHCSYFDDPHTWDCLREWF